MHKHFQGVARLRTAVAVAFTLAAILASAGVARAGHVLCVDSVVESPTGLGTNDPAALYSTRVSGLGGTNPYSTERTETKIVKVQHPAMCCVCGTCAPCP